MSRRGLGTDLPRLPAMTAAERQRRYRERVKAATAAHGPLLISRHMRVRDMKAVAARIIDQTTPEVARRIAQEIEAELKARVKRARVTACTADYMSEPMAARLLGLKLPTSKDELLRGETLTAVEIEGAYRKKVMLHHPDTGGARDPDLMPTLQYARDLLLKCVRGKP